MKHVNSEIRFPTSHFLVNFANDLETFRKGEFRLQITCISIFLTLYANSNCFGPTNKFILKHVIAHLSIISLGFIHETNLPQREKKTNIFLRTIDICDIHFSRL